MTDNIYIPAPPPQDPSSLPVYLNGELVRLSNSVQQPPQGEQGEAGADGTSATHEWSGTSLRFTDANGTGSYVNLKGDDGADGADGADGGFTTNSNAQVNSLGVGTAGSGVTGEIRATNNITAYYSDDRLKTRGSNIQNPLEKLQKLNGFYYQANEVAVELGYEKKDEVGVSAQEVQSVLPEIVVPAPISDKYLTVYYEKLIPLLIEAVKELDTKVSLLGDIDRRLNRIISHFED